MSPSLPWFPRSPGDTAQVLGLQGALCACWAPLAVRALSSDSGFGGGTPQSHTQAPLTPPLSPLPPAVLEAQAPLGFLACQMRSWHSATKAMSISQQGHQRGARTPTP